MGSSVKVIPSFSSVCLYLTSIPLIVRHNLVWSVLWCMLSMNSLHYLLLWSDVTLEISSFIVDNRGEARYCLRMLLLSGHSLDPCLWGESDHPNVGPPASLSLHLASSSITPAGSVHKSSGDNVVRMRVKR